MYAHAWVGCAIYVLVLVGVAWVLSNGLVRLDAFDLGELDAAIAAVLAKGLRTADIKSEGTTAASTSEMGQAILGEMQKLH